MTLHLGKGRSLASALVTSLVLALSVLVAPAVTAPAEAATPITVSQAIGQQTGATQTVRGYVVGQPTATSTVVRSGFPSDYALAIADSASQTNTSSMLYVQIPSAFRAQWGLRTNPSLMGKQIDVTGALSAYFSHPGMTSTSAFALAGGTTPTEPPPTGGTSPWDATYYAPAVGRTGTALRTSLHDIIDDNTRLSYDAVWTALKDTDQDPNNTGNVIELYTGRSISKSSNGGSVGNWNREHVWAQSRGGFTTSAGPGTDLHHLRPEDVTVNGTRGNKDFDNGGTAVSGCTDCWTDSDSFEPRDAVKGDVARMLLYMAVRYEGDDGFQDLEMSTVSGSAVPRIGDLDILLQWNSADPVDAFEMRRNDRIHAQWQGNRNPFIDHPEWAAAIWN
ncbi:Endonuclease I [Nocardioides alpinus]|uniref:Endonuclease I n=1 Tax=Nocardioides alpinus TaxID=748909 RepID=A0A1I0VVR0_9ACTN|nr:endonuclease [Nocardioides alpinus]PKH37516.1 ribonuclease [Nocardioides alpinus]SFA80432.1 Endonuclease I [Nocardioides alpinus]